jgi:organic hydroperoxide reductase OsmC/OhrA
VVRHGQDYNGNDCGEGHAGDSSGTSGYREYGRDHEVTISGAAEGEGAGDAGRPQPIAGSSDSAFRGDPGRWNPEQLLTAALAQCHMLSYLHACAAAGIVARRSPASTEHAVLRSSDSPGTPPTHPR